MAVKQRVAITYRELIYIIKSIRPTILTNECSAILYKSVMTNINYDRLTRDESVIPSMPIAWMKPGLLLKSSLSNGFTYSSKLCYFQVASFKSCTSSLALSTISKHNKKL